ncbi:MAG: hypothetical protein IJ716_11010 [Lachnospiraceae bacterium]|nr:hypothetical protein [Lachnospiraceae bacterium]
MTNWMTAVCRIGVFMICAQTLIHCRPNGSYEKYLKMLLSAMILIQLVLPINRILTGTGEESLEERMKWFQEQLQVIETSVTEQDETVPEEAASAGTGQGNQNIEEVDVDKIDRVKIKPVMLGEEEDEKD